MQRCLSLCPLSMVRPQAQTCKKAHTSFFLSLTDPHYKVRNIDDLLNNDPAWYDTVNMIVGLKQIDVGKQDVKSVFMFLVI
jgi:hypothetical protein